MRAIVGPITGNEVLDGGVSPIGALAEFYNAFNGRDLQLMSANWLGTPEASMSNPLGDIKRGWAELATVYDKIFHGPAKVYVEFWDYTIIEAEGFFQAVGRERGSFAINEQAIELRIRTSRSFVARDGRYRQLHHHGSIDEPQLLDHYQRAVRTGKLN